MSADQESSDSQLCKYQWDLTFRNESVEGLQVKLLKSALQKLARRQIKDVGLKVLALLDSCANLENKKGRSSSAAKTIRTNVMNRLVCMMSEEVNIHESNMPVIMKQKYEQWCRVRTTDLLLARRLWFEMYQLLCDSRKCRVISDLKSLYTLPPYYTKDPKHQLEVSKRCCAEFNHPAFLERKLLVDEKLGENQLLQRIGIAMKTTSSQIAPSSGFNIHHPIWNMISVWLERGFDLNSLWDVVDEVAKSTQNPHFKSMESLRFFFKKMSHQEKPIYFYHAILLILYPVVDNQVQELHHPEQSLKTPVNVAELVIPEFCHDIHTGASDKDRVTFALEGALIVNEDERFLDRSVRRMYIRTKEILEAEYSQFMSMKARKSKRKLTGGTSVPDSEHEDEDVVSNGNVDASGCGNTTSTTILVASEASIEDLEAKQEISLDHESAHVPSSQKRSKTKSAQAASSAPSWPPPFLAELEYRCEELPVSEEERIKTLPHAQKLCAKFKKIVFVDAQQIFKGPYFVTDKSLLLNLKRIRQVQYLQHKAHMDSTVIPWTRVLVADMKSEAPRIYLEMPNVGRPPTEGDWSILQTTFQAEAPIMRRCSHVLRLSEAEKTVVVPRAELIHALEHLYICFLLNIGDNGSHNILYAPDRAGQKVVGIDLEEIRTVSAIQIYTPCLPEMKYFKDAFDVAELQVKLGVDIDDALEIEKRRVRFEKLMQDAE